ncbi:MAG TPA: type II toxin-antitoxin system VapC family toxin [Stellaceae bacterium]|jgi:PIN domain nuclease of toxin-antitoxin system|nr:type II toxin-antitoxin system VapC family toxin [Stellaceae bacterium]
MRLLLDTHVLLWWLSGNRALSVPARAAIADDDNATLVSAASAWEIAIKFKQGKLPTAGGLVRDIEGTMDRHGFLGLSVTILDGQHAGSLPLHHKDPFDRLLIAQALAGSLTLISNERLFDRYGVARLW